MQIDNLLNIALSFVGVCSTAMHCVNVANHVCVPQVNRKLQRDQLVAAGHLQAKSLKGPAKRRHKLKAPCPAASQETAAPSNAAARQASSRQLCSHAAKAQLETDRRQINLIADCTAAQEAVPSITHDKTIDATEDMQAGPTTAYDHTQQLDDTQLQTAAQYSQAQHHLGTMQQLQHAAPSEDDDSTMMLKPPVQHSQGSPAIPHGQQGYSHTAMQHQAVLPWSMLCSRLHSNRVLWLTQQAVGNSSLLLYKTTESVQLKQLQITRLSHQTGPGQ